MTDLLRVSNLTLAYGTAPALVCDLSFELVPGESLGIVGPSGAGKTLVVSTLLGLAPSAVRVREGHAAYQLKSGVAVNVLELGRKERMALRGREIGMVFQEPRRALNPVLSCGRQLREAARTLCSGGVNQEERLRDTLRQVELAPDQERILRALPHELSGGQLQRVMIAMALIGRPRLLIADEPTTALDAITEAAIVRLLDRLRQDLQMGLIFITHDRSLLERATDRLIAIPTLAPRRTERITTRESATQPVHKATPQKPCLSVEHLTVTYGGGTKALREVSLQLHRGQTVAVTGPSGCGKTTLVKWMVGLVTAGSGMLRVGDRTFTLPSAGRTIRQATGAQLIFQDVAGSLNPRMSVRQLILSVPGSTPQQADDLLTQLGLPPQRYGHRLPDQLSGGERQRVAIARALAARPRILICDEAFSGLDAPTRTDIQQQLRQLVRTRNLTLINITHSLPDILKFADRVLVMEDGRVAESGFPATVFGESDKEITRKLVAAAGLG